MDRRDFLIQGALALGGGLLAPSLRADARELQRIRSDWQRFVPAGAEIARTTEPLRMSDEAWRAKLTRAQYRVLRHEGTERAYSSPLDREKRDGLFVCAGCRLPLFTSEMKYDSGTGWPSFFTHIPDHLGTKTDHLLILPRTEYHCIRCEGHHGHVFMDGPQPTGERWCSNGVALLFLPL